MSNQTTPPPPNRNVTLHDIPGHITPVEIFAVDESGSGGAHSHYRVDGVNLCGNKAVDHAIESGVLKTIDHECLDIFFQNGAIPEHGYNGVTIEQLLAICGHRLECFQAGPFACKNNANALDHIKAAIKLLNQRTVDCIARGVEGKEAL